MPAFLGHRVGFHHVTGGRASNIAVSSIPSFFGRFRRMQAACEQQTQKEQERRPRVDIYRLLGVPHNAPADAIASRAKELEGQLTRHADTTTVDPLLLSLFNEVVATLKAPDLRSAYDENGILPESLSALLQQLLPALSYPHSSDSTEQGITAKEYVENREPVRRRRGPAELFSSLLGRDFFGKSSPFAAAAAAGRRHTQGSQQGLDVEAHVTLSFVDAALNGACSLPVIVRRQETCTACAGPSTRRTSPCPVCEGQGMQTETRRSSFGFVTTSVTCSACNATGISQGPLCKSCEGEGLISKDVHLKVNIPAGVLEGSLLRVEGEGSEGRNGEARGDLYISIGVESHDRLTREGADVCSEESISLEDAVYGCSITVHTVDGDVELKIPALSRSGRKFLIKGRGAKKIDDPSGARGDHVVTLRVALPETATAKDRELLKSLREAEDVGE
ncbi:DnaJ domain-containing protein, putative [Eimeria tenella]|uniref:DnaJ domain-containing protein, putative n=1 Tax=Eimeria tenella TaxID=5802 RepID=U6L1R5_EIMTE|nr:DnaJ domain-containing protein, putative [Eimeria tenella]CDJ42524.1 DnaJ domain-containing protein, putative [Eimeria tenella]|eukprot:XP_013233274.1 DnaJ domain-containing protein, putative [Eimeria tenella]